MFGLHKKFDQQVLSTTMMSAVNEVFNKMCSEKFSRSPSVRPSVINIEKFRKINVSGFEKFYQNSFISAVNLFKSESDQGKNTICGFVVVYIKEAGLWNVFKALQFPVPEHIVAGTLLDLCGEFCNIISGEFRNQLGKMGYPNILTSAPMSAAGALSIEAAHIPRGLEDCQELSFYLFDTKTVIVDVSLSHLVRGQR